MDGSAEDDSEDGEDVSEAACFEDIEPDLSELTVTGQAESGNFETEDAWVSSTASVYRTEEEAQEAFEGGRDVLQSDELAACLDLAQAGIHFAVTEAIDRAPFERSLRFPRGRHAKGDVSVCQDRHGHATLRL